MRAPNWILCLALSVFCAGGLTACKSSGGDEGNGAAAEGEGEGQEATSQPAEGE